MILSLKERSLELGELCGTVGVEGARLLDGALVDDPHLARDAAHKVLVVRDEHHAALEALDAVGQAGHRLKVEVIGRLVEDLDGGRRVGLLLGLG